MHNLVYIFLMFVFVPFDLFAAKVLTTPVVATGTKVTTAATNTLVDSECQDSYFGCMDAFCILDNISGGRCQCSNKHIALSAKMKEIMDMDNQAYAIATYGVEHIELGKAADDVLSSSERAFDKAIRDANDEPVADKVKKTEKLTLSDWNSFFSSRDDEDDEEVFELDDDDVAKKTGDELYKVAMQMCFEQTPEKCKASEDMLKMMYVQKIRSDCAAFENSLNKQEIEVYAKLEDAKSGVRAAALTEVKNANKYTLGECALEFRKCMQEQAGCGEDWTGCVKLAASENMENNAPGSVAQPYTIQGTLTNITIAATSMDTLLAKKPLCEYVTEQCVNEKSKVWDVFVRDVAPSIKSAELAAESTMRSSCLSSISQCYLTACRENMDPKDPDGSYDMCLSRPDNYKAFCKVQLEPCLHATGGTFNKPETSSLWQGILAKLASLRVDACTNEFKTCIQDDDRCGSDYSQCIGLDNEDVAELCPEEKLTACYKEYNNKTETVRESLERMAQGILLNADNDLLTACENAVVDSMLNVCGDTESCDRLVDVGVGSRSLKLRFCERDGNRYFNCKETEGAISDIELGKTTRDSDLIMEKHNRHFFVAKFDGQIYWDFVDFGKNGYGIMDIKDYERSVRALTDMDNDAHKRVQSELVMMDNTIKNAIDTIESDPRVQYCMTGRQVAGLTSSDGFTKFIGKKNNARFPNITRKYRRIIVDTVMQQVRKNYFHKYDELYTEYLTGQTKLSERMREIDGINDKENRFDSARLSCIQLGEGEKFTKKWDSPSAVRKVNRKSGNDGKLVGYSSESTYTYKRQVTTTFNMEKLSCHKCVRTQNCKKIGAGEDHCKTWADEQEECTDIQF